MTAHRRPLTALAATLALSAGGALWGVGVSAQDSAAPAGPGTPPPAAAAPGPTPHEEAGRCVEGTEYACLELTRKGKQDGKERRILVIRAGTTDTTGIYTVCGRRDDEPETTPTQLVFSETGPGGIRLLIDKNLIRVPLAVVSRQATEGEEAEEGGDGRVEASAGTATYLDDIPEGVTDRLVKCGVKVTPELKPDTVFVTQGKTQLRGQKLVYDETDGVARIDGPITFARENGEDSLSGKSDRIDVNVDEEKTVLIGNVELRSKGGRVSRAARVEYDDTANLARLYGTPGQPAESVLGKDVFRAGVILYYLDRNEVYSVKPEGGTITGEFQDGESSPAAPTTPSTP